MKATTSLLRSSPRHPADTHYKVCSTSVWPSEDTIMLPVYQIHGLGDIE